MAAQLLDIIGQMQDRSVGMMSDAIQEGSLDPNIMQLPFHAGRINNQELLFAMKSAGQGLEKTPYFLDPGCGDGFSLILASCLGYNAIGLEIENALVDIARENVDSAKKIGLVKSPEEIRVEQGDMFNLESYEKTRVRFDEVDIFYMFAISTQRDDFIKQFSRQAKEDARLLLVPGIKDRPKQNTFKNIQNMQLMLEGPEQSYQVYKKTSQ